MSMTADRLAQALLAAVRAQRLDAVPDARQGGAPVGVHPSIDLAVAGFPADGPPVWANVLFSREHAPGLVAGFDGAAGSVATPSFVADRRDAQLVSIAWQPGTDWSCLPWLPLQGVGLPRVVAPYPASLLKLMVAVGVCRAVDDGRARFDQPWSWQGQVRTVDAWCTEMIVVSCNDSTSAMVALLHAAGQLGGAGEAPNALEAAFDARGLHTLRLAGTRPDGGWGNAAGAGVGCIQMTAWDTLRLLWLLDPQAPPPPWPQAAPLMSSPARDRLLGWLQGQRLHHVLGLPAELGFAHKTGTTENYASDAGIVQARPPHRRHYLIALLSNLGSRYVPGAPEGETPEALRRLGVAVDRVMAAWLEPPAIGGADTGRPGRVR